MSNRNSFSRLLFLLSAVILLVSLLLAALTIVYAVLVGMASAQEIAPLSTVKPGDRGYGLTVFQGLKPEKFEYEVKGILELGDEKYIVIRLSGGPKINGEDVLADTNIFAGMSGSPIFNQDGKILGAISRAPKGEKKPIAFATPIESLVYFKPKALLGPNLWIENVLPVKPSLISAGDSFECCEVWGHDISCVIGTVSLVDPVDPTIIYTLGHSGNDNTNIMAWPFWLNKVITIIPNINSSRKIGNQVNPVLGSVIFDGPFGQILKVGAMPKFIPMKIITEGNLSQKVEANIFYAYTPNTARYISTSILGRKKFVIGQQDIDAEIRIDPKGLPQIFSYGYLGDTTIAGMLAEMFIGEKLKTGVESINVILRPRNKYKKLSLDEVNVKTLSTEDDILNLEVEIKASGNSEMGRWEYTFHAKVSQEFVDKKIYIADGETVLDKIIPSLKPTKESVDLLNKVSDRNSLYVFFTDANISSKMPVATLVLNLSEDSRMPSIKDAIWDEDDSAKAKIQSSTLVDVDKNKKLLNQWLQKDNNSEILQKIDAPAGDYLIRGIKEFTVKADGAATKKDNKEKKKKKLFGIF